MQRQQSTPLLRQKTGDVTERRVVALLAPSLVVDNPARAGSRMEDEGLDLEEAKVLARTRGAVAVVVLGP